MLREVAHNLGLTVNMDKSNVIVFRNGGILAAAEKWMYDGLNMKVVNVYKYLGIMLSTRLSYTHTLNDVATRAKKGVITNMHT